MKIKSNTKEHQIKYNPDQFKTWILKNYTLSPKAAADVVSRLNRIKKYVDLESTSDDEKIVNQIRHHPDFERASVAVFSQLKNAIRKYTTFAKQLKS